MIAVTKQKNSRGFTITELLVVISIMAILGVIFTNILVDTLRGRNKVKAINQVKQNGQVVLDQLSNEIRNAKKIICVGTYGSGVTNNTIVITTDAGYSLFRLIPSPPNSLINGKIQKTTLALDQLNTTTEAALCTSDSLNIGNFVQSLTDTDSKNGVSMLAPPSPGNIFQQNGDIIIIKFNVSAGVQAGYAYDMTVADGGIPFSTSVQARKIHE